ncbi:hypothetical protein OpiT1DRAFT_01722 [Opitutaceae bacterium TAV1]|nr:hypothetical protein OpiT1DRAFT_01722 [Opitutaceae bacterium TAV1]
MFSFPLPWLHPEKAEPPCRRRQGDSGQGEGNQVRGILNRIKTLVYSLPGVFSDNPELQTLNSELRPPNSGPELNFSPVCASGVQL